MFHGEVSSVSVAGKAIPSSSGSTAISTFGLWKDAVRAVHPARERIAVGRDDPRFCFPAAGPAWGGTTEAHIMATRHMRLISFIAADSANAIPGSARNRHQCYGG